MKIAGMTAGKNAKTPAGVEFDADFYIRNYFTPAEASAEIGVPVREIHRLVGDETLDGATHPCGGLLIARDSVARYKRELE